MKRNKLFSTAGAAITAVALAFTLAACSSSSKSTDKTSTGAPTSGTAGALPGKGKPAVTMGDKDFDEQFLLGELYAQALRAKGFTINLKKNIGSSEIINQVLRKGKIAMYPEYTGVIYSNAALANLGDKPKSAAATYAGAKKWEESHGFTMLKPTPFQDADGIAVTKAYAQKNNLKQISDLKKISHFTYAGPKENRNRYQGVLGLNKAYGLHNFTFKALPTGSQYGALDRGDIDSIAIFTTDAQLASNKYTVLTDTEGIFGYQQVAPVVKQSVLSAQGPEFAKTLDAVSALLTTDAIISMNKAVQVDKKDPAVVAKAFLQANHLA